MKNLATLLLFLLLASCSATNNAVSTTTDTDVIELSDNSSDELLEIRDNNKTHEVKEVTDSKKMGLPSDDEILIGVGSNDASGYEVQPNTVVDTPTLTTPIVEPPVVTTPVIADDGESVFVDPAESMRAMNKEVTVYSGAVQDEKPDYDSFAEKPSKSKRGEKISYNDFSEPVAVNGGEVKNYQVQKNETLMMIAFKLYGDYRKWHDLARLNRDRLGNSNRVAEGTNLRYEDYGTNFSWNPDGEPYLIKLGDTLSLISNNVYGTRSKWPSIWNNNKPLIRDPNRIYAGFTLYYLTDGSTN